MAERDVARRARTWVKVVREALDAPGEPEPSTGPRAPAFLRDRVRPPPREPRAGELWMAFPTGRGLPTPVALVGGTRLVVVPMTREVWLADEHDPLLPAEESPTGEWLAALLPGAAAARLELLRTPVGGLPESLVTVLRRLVDTPGGAIARGPVPLPATDTDVPQPSHATSWSADADGETSWLAGLPLAPGDVRAEARCAHLEAVAWLSAPSPRQAPVRPGLLDRLRAALESFGDRLLDLPSEGAPSWALTAAPGPVRAAGLTGRPAPLETAVRLGDLLAELSFEEAVDALRVTLVATRQGRPVAGVRLAVESIDGTGGRVRVERLTGEEGLVTGLRLPLDEGTRHELTVEAGGQRRHLAF
jgi:hypothetical protein